MAKRKNPSLLCTQTTLPWLLEWSQLYSKDLREPLYFTMEEEHDAVTFARQDCRTKATAALGRVLLMLM